MQRYKAAGVAQGSEIHVNTTTLFEELHPDITGLPDGGWVVTWVSGYFSDGIDGYIGAILQQRYDSNGVKYGLETLVNTETMYDQYQPSVIYLNDGGWLTSWLSLDQDGDGSGIYMQRYDVDSKKVGVETRVNFTTIGDQAAPDVSLLEDGGWVVTWSGDQSGTYDVYQQRYRSNGTEVGTEVRVNKATAGDQSATAVTALKDGGWVVAWDSGGQDGDGYGIYLQRYNALGNKVGDEGSIAVNTFATGDQMNASITALTDGGWVVTWESYGQEDPINDPSGAGLYLQQFGSDGSKVGGEVIVNTYTAGDQTSHSVAALDDGGWVVTWTDHSGRDGTFSSDVYQKEFHPINDAPTAANKAITVVEDTTHIFTAADFGMVDVNGDALANVIVTGFSGNGTLTLNGGSVSAGQIIEAAFLSTLVWTPTADANGNNLAQFIFKVQDNGGTAHGGLNTSAASYTITLGATPVNDAPVVFSAIQDQAATEDSAFSYQFAATVFKDAESTTLEYTATMQDGSALPTWLTFDPTTRTFTGTPLNGNVGTLTVKVTASDGELSVSDQFNINVQNTNDAPALVNPIADAQALKGAAFSYTFSASAFADSDLGDTLNYTAALENGAVLPSWLVFNSTTRTFSGTPGSDDVGVFSIKVTASDGQTSASDAFALNVTQVNTPPAPVNDTAIMSEHATAVVDVLGNDLDPDGDTLQLGSASVTSGNGAVVKNLDGTLSVTYTGADIDISQTAQVIVSYEAFDGIAKTGATLTVTVNGAHEEGDDIIGNSKANKLNGTDVGETIKGLGGKDRITGNGGNDLLYGGGAKDIFFFDSGDGKDRVKDFSLKGGDVIDLSGVNEITSFQDLLKHAVDKGNNVLIKIDNQNSILVEHVHENQLTAGDFQF